MNLSFDHFNASLSNKSIIFFFKKFFLTPKRLNSVNEFEYRNEKRASYNRCIQAMHVWINICNVFLNKWIHNEPWMMNHTVCSWDLSWLLSLFYSCDLGCCLIPCIIDDLKDVTHTCPNCKGYIYTYKRIC